MCPDRLERLEPGGSDHPILAPLTFHMKDHANFTPDHSLHRLSVGFGGAGSELAPLWGGAPSCFCHHESPHEHGPDERDPRRASCRVFAGHGLKPCNGERRRSLFRGSIADRDPPTPCRDTRTPKGWADWREDTRAPLCRPLLPHGVETRNAARAPSPTESHRCALERTAIIPFRSVWPGPRTHRLEGRLAMRTPRRALTTNVPEVPSTACRLGEPVRLLLGLSSF